MSRTPFVRANGGGREDLHVVAAAGATPSVDLANGNVQDFTLDANATFTFTGSVADLACGFTLIVRQDATGGRTVTWPAAVDWVGLPAAPTMPLDPNLRAILTFLTIDNGTTWIGAVAALESDA